MIDPILTLVKTENEGVGNGYGYDDLTQQVLKKCP